MNRRKIYLLSSVLTIVIISAGYFVFIKHYHGSDKIVLLNDGDVFTSFDDIIKRPEFKSKIVYVDVWGANCGPCYDDFEKYTPQLTAHFRDAKDVAFLYICVDRRPLQELRWKRKIKQFSPDGYHVLVKGGIEERKLAMDIIGEAADGKYFPYEPCYFIVNKKGQIIDRPTLDIEKHELTPADKTLLYEKLDSLKSQ